MVPLVCAAVYHLRGRVEFKVALSLGKQKFVRETSRREPGFHQCSRFVEAGIARAATRVGSESARCRQPAEEKYETLQTGSTGFGNDAGVQRYCSRSRS